MRCPRILFRVRLRCTLLAIAVMIIGFATSPATNAASYEKKTAELPGVSLTYVDTGGDGSPVIFVHALTGTSDSWEHQLHAFAAAGYRAIAFDRRGWGGSVANGDSGAQPGTGAADIDALANHLNLGKFHLVGVAGGGFVALDYAAWKSDRLRSVVVAASTGALEEKEIKEFSKRIEIPNVPWPSLYLEVGPSYIGGDVEGLARWKQIEEHARQPHAPNQPLRAPNTFRKIAAIEAPMLVLAASADWLAPPALMKLWASKVKNMEFDEICDAGHSVAWEKPDEFNSRVLQFMRKY